MKLERELKAVQHSPRIAGTLESGRGESQMIMLTPTDVSYFQELDELYVNVSDLQLKSTVSYRNHN